VWGPVGSVHSVVFIFTFLLHLFLRDVLISLLEGDVKKASDQFVTDMPFVDTSTASTSGEQFWSVVTTGRALDVLVMLLMYFFCF